jgi:Na+-driven multidrug efflux pump
MYGCFGISVIVWGLMTGLIWAFFPKLLSMYGVVDEGVGSLGRIAYETAQTRFLYIGALYFLCGVMETCSSVLRGLGKSLTSTIISLIGACLFRVVWLWTVFTRYPTLGVIFISYPISWVLVIVASFGVILYTLSKLIRQKKLREEITQ